MSKLFMIGATGLVGGEFLSYSSNSPNFTKIWTLTRRNLNKSISEEKVTSIVEPDTLMWQSIIEKSYSKEGERPDIFFSGLGTTKGAAGGFDNQYKIDHDMNLELAKTAKNAGIKTYVLISSKGADENSLFPYLKMKGTLDKEIIDLKFEKTVILRPGILLGDRDKEKGLGNSIAAFVGGLLHKSDMINRCTGNAIYGNEIAFILDELLKNIDALPQVKIVDSEEMFALLKSKK